MLKHVQKSDKIWIKYTHLGNTALNPQPYTLTKPSLIAILNTRDLFVQEHTNQNPFLCSFGGPQRAPPHFYTEINVFRKDMN